MTGPSAAEQRVSRIPSSVPPIPPACPSDSTTSSLTLTICGLARFWTPAPGWEVLSERENEIVIGTDQNAPAGMCFMPVTDAKTVQNRARPGRS